MICNVSKVGSKYLIPDKKETGIAVILHGGLVWIRDYMSWLFLVYL